MLASQLPAGAQTWISCGYDAAWSPTAHIAALAVDALQVSNWQRAGGSTATRPKPLTRPSEVAEMNARAEREAARAEAFAQRQKDRKNAPHRDARGRFVKRE